MTARSRKARRILALQDQLHRASEWKLAGIKSEIAENQRTREALIGSLANEALGPLLVENTARRLRHVAQAHDQLARLEQEQAARVREEARRLKRAERMVEGVRQADERAREKADFNAILDGVAARSDKDVDASLPPA